MRGMVFALMILASFGAGPAFGQSRYEVHGVEAEDMLKMRAGPGTGYVVILGLPNGTEVRIISCQLIGGTNWCKVALEMARTVTGYVSFTYLREK